ncbi:hypothetical protein [Pontibacter sp. G13]|uniref:TlpA family protein disulfide reductase n=1 Tax=Pontibacter sp. G13 TaxID=3074898 RepID=UPI002889D128|nr:hypothetical protein [Pontibacter sp. G13]WNJ17556.1 hypothetical protein RJD25_22125 [Pontibacter sp. G13]
MMKKGETVILIGLSLVLGGGLVITQSVYGLLASLWMLGTGFALFGINAIAGIKALAARQWTLVVRISLGPFIGVYTVAVWLFTHYWVGLSGPEAQFDWRFMLEGFPHEQAVMLPILYGLGLTYGYLRTHPRAIAWTVGIVGVLGLLGFGTWAIWEFRVADSRHADVQFVEGEFRTLEALLADPAFAGKRVYVDVWHSSCKPCLQQFRDHLPALKESFEGEDFMYLYIARETSHPNSRDRWLSVIEDYHLSGWHAYYPKDETETFFAELMKQAEISQFAFPHYFVVQDGQILVPDAPRPSQLAELRELLGV